MELPLHTGYALRTLIFLTVKEGHHSIADIAQAYGISKNHLMKVAQRLAAKGFFEGVRGRSGGLRLAQAADALNVGAIMRVMEDTKDFVECFDPATNSCVVTPVCGLRHALAGALEAFVQHLDQFTMPILCRILKATEGNSACKSLLHQWSNKLGRQLPDCRISGTQLFVFRPELRALLMICFRQSERRNFLEPVVCHRADKDRHWVVLRH